MTPNGVTIFHVKVLRCREAVWPPPSYRRKRKRRMREKACEKKGMSWREEGRKGKKNEEVEKEMKRSEESKIEIKGGKRSNKDGEGEEERKRETDFKRPNKNKITSSSRNCLLCGLRGKFSTLGSFSSFLKCRTNYKSPA